MEHKYFPMFIDISKKKIVVIGGGVIATRRVKTLSEFCENIMVVAPEITPSLQELAGQGKIRWAKEAYRKSWLEGADIVIAATNQPMINREIAGDCFLQEMETDRKIWFNTIDDKTRCDFYFPSIVQHDEVIVGISSGGSSPKQTKQARIQIEKALDSNSIYE